MKQKIGNILKNKKIVIPFLGVLLVALVVGIIMIQTNRKRESIEENISDSTVQDEGSLENESLLSEEPENEPLHVEEVEAEVALEDDEDSFMEEVEQNEKENENNEEEAFVQKSPEAKEPTIEEQKAPAEEPAQIEEFQNEKPPTLPGEIIQTEIPTVQPEEVLITEIPVPEPEVVPQVIPISSVLLDQTELLLVIGGQETLHAVVGPENTTESSVVTWSSTNPLVATVNEGVISGIAPGESVIVATCGNISAYCSVTVPQPVVAAVNTGNSSIVVLDPGHDGVHGGAFYFGRKEQDLSLAVAYYCKYFLETNYGLTVYMTRYGNEALDPSRDMCLIDRCIYAQSVGAATLVSLHFNSSGGRGASGATVIVSSHANVANQSAALGTSILTQLCGLGLPNRGLLYRSHPFLLNPDGTKQDYYSITRNCAILGIPAVIVEHCYMDRDVNYINSDAALMQLGLADAIGIASYLGL